MILDPIIILGAPRSGTCLLARILGSTNGNFLITEHQPRLKERSCPEDKSGINDAHLWWQHFEFESWDSSRERPLIETPIFDDANIKRLRAHYLDLAGSKRLVIKNPRHLARVAVLKTMFPEARFVFSLRGPWETIQSATIKGKTSFLLRTKFVNSMPDDLVLRAAAGWAEGIDVLKRERDDKWLLVRHEDLLANPRKVVSNLYADLAIDDPVAFERASILPERREHDYSFIKGQLLTNPHRWKIARLVVPRAWSVGYSGLTHSLTGSGTRYLMADRSGRKPKAIERRNRQGNLAELPGFLPT